MTNATTHLSNQADGDRVKVQGVLAVEHGGTGAGTAAGALAALGAEAAGSASAALSAHVGAADPHTQYAKKAGDTFSGNVGIDKADPTLLFSTSGSTKASISANSSGTLICSGRNPDSLPGFLMRPVGPGTTAGQFALWPDGTAIFSGVTRPSADNSYTLGASSQRWSTVYAATGTINTSDAREKTPLDALATEELAAAQAMAEEIGTYRWLASIDAKGDAARTHLGLTVQRAIEIMAAHGLEPTRYAFICRDQWAAQPEVWAETPAVLDEDGNEVAPATRALIQEAQPAGDRYGFRHDQLLLFLLAGERAARRAMEDRLAALEARLA